MTGPADRHLRFDGVRNMRDVGGLMTSDGRLIRRGELFRAEALAAPGSGEAYAEHSDALAAHLEPLGLRTVIDLRTALECERIKGLWASTAGARVIEVPIPEGAPGSDNDIFAMLLDGRLSHLTAERLGQFYIEALSRRPREFATAISIIADQAQRPLLIHCTGGKDRTGLAVALLLDVLGVPLEVIVDDYVQTGRNRPDRAQGFVEMFAEAGVAIEDARVLFETPAEAMEIALAFIYEKYGSAGAYLVAEGGIDESVLTRLREGLLEPEAVR